MKFHYYFPWDLSTEDTGGELQSARTHVPSRNKDAERQGSYGARASFKRWPYGMAHVRKTHAVRCGGAMCHICLWIILVGYYSFNDRIVMQKTPRNRSRD